MANIFNIEENLLAIIDKIEEEGGEIMPELEEEYAITQEQFKAKVKSYSNAIKMLENHIVDIKAEVARLKDLQQSKEKTIERLKKIVIEAVKLFGDTNKSGNQFIDYGTGKVSIRRSQIVEVDEDVTNRLVNRYMSAIKWYNDSNQLDCVTPTELLDYCNTLSPKEADDGYDITTVTESDISSIKTNINLDITLTELLSSKYCIKLAKALVEYGYFDCKSKVNKSDIKANAKINNTLPAFAKLVDNETITIK